MNQGWVALLFSINFLLHHHLVFCFSLPKIICGRDLPLAVTVVIPWTITKTEGEIYYPCQLLAANVKEQRFNYSFATFQGKII